MKPADILQKLEDLNSFVMDAERAVLDGKTVDLRSLARDVDVVCRQATALPPQEAQALQPIMAEMIGNLDRLEQSLKDFRERLKKK